jgi:serine/threonine protein kinase
MHQAALGLQHIHEHHLVHRDIKPSNLMIVRKGEQTAETHAGSVAALPAEMTGSWEQVKILDLGLARLVEDTGIVRPGLTQFGAIMGTADYMAPEQSLQSSRVDIRGDIYSLGCTLYFILVGRPPFLGGNSIEKLLKHQLDTPEPVESLRPEVPAGLTRVLQRMMARRAQDRYQTPSEVALALQEVEDTLMPLAIPAVPVLPAATLSAPPRARRVDPALIAAAAPQPETATDESAAFPLDETAAAVVLANRIAQAHADQSEWSLWLVLALVGFSTLLCLLFAIFVLSH